VRPSQRLADLSDLVGPADERGGLRRQVPRQDIGRTQWREVRAESRGFHLEDVLAARQVPQQVLSQIYNLDLGRQGVGHHVSRGCRCDHLPTMSQRHETGCPVDGRAEMVPVALLHLAGVQAHTYGDDGAGRPSLAGQHQLGVHRRCDGVTGTGEGHCEAVPAGREHVTSDPSTAERTNWS
jgi:hypothetical protein